MERQPIVTWAAPYDNSYGVKHKVMKTYSFLIAELAITWLTAIALFHLDPVVTYVRTHFVATLMAISLLTIFNSWFFFSVSRDSRSSWNVMCFLLNYFLSATPMIFVEPYVFYKSILITLVLVIMLSLKSFLVSEEVVAACVSPLRLFTPFLWLCTAYFLLFNAVNDSASLLASAISLHVGFLVYAILLMKNTLSLKWNAQRSWFDPFHTSFIFYVNIMNMFSRVITILHLAGESDKC